MKDKILQKINFNSVQDVVNSKSASKKRFRGLPKEVKGVEHVTSAQRTSALPLSCKRPNEILNNYLYHNYQRSGT